MRGVLDRYEEYKKHDGLRSKHSMEEYLKYKQSIELPLKDMHTHDVAILHSKKEKFSMSSWKHQSAPYLDLDEDFDLDEEYAVMDKDHGIDFFKKTPAIKKEIKQPTRDTQKLLKAYNRSRLGSYSSYSINEAGYMYLTEQINAYYRSKNIDNAVILADLIFGTTPLKGHFVCSYSTPLIGKARNASAAANTIGDFIKKNKTPKS